MKILHLLNNSVAEALQEQLNAKLETKDTKQTIHIDCQCGERSIIYSDLCAYCNSCNSTKELIEIIPSLDLTSSPIIKELSVCEIYQSLSDSNNYVFFNPKTKEQHKNYDIKSVKDAFKPVMFNQLIARTQTLKFDYNPSKPYKFDGCHNLYTPPDWKRDAFYNGANIESEMCPSVYLEFFRHLVGDDKESFDYLLDWLSVSLKGRNQQYLILLGEGGIGKGALSEILRRLHGNNNFETISNQDFRSGFNAKMQNKTLYYFNELAIERGEEWLIDKLKLYVEPMISIQPKGHDTIDIENHGNIYISANRMKFPIEHDERRYSFLYTGNDKLSVLAEKHNKNLKEYLFDILYNADNINYLAKALWHRKLKNNMDHSYKNSNKLYEIMDENLTEWAKYVIDIICTREAGKAVTIKEIQDELSGNGCDFTVGREAIKKLARQTSNKYFTYHQTRGTSNYYIVCAKNGTPEHTQTDSVV